MKTKLTLVVLLALALLLSQGTTALGAGRWYVNAATGNDGNDCQTATTACKTIGHAVLLAATGDVISIAAGTYFEHMTIDKGLTLLGADQATTIIDGATIDDLPVMEITTASPVRLSRVTIQNGVSWGGGGAILAWGGGTLFVTNSTFTNNGDSAIYGVAKGTFSDSTFTSNWSGFGGGAIYNNGTLTVKNCTFIGNEGGANGGAIQNDSHGTLTVINSTFSDNHASDGGAIYNGATLFHSKSTSGEGTVFLSNSTFSGNSGSNGGGAIINLDTMNAENITVSGNSAPIGGGFYNIFSSSHLTLSNSTVSNNTGGAIYHFQGSATLQNTVLGNAPGQGDNCYGGGFTSNGYNLSSDSSCASYFTNSGDLNNVDPRLGPLQDNGGPTWTQALLRGSPAIDAGNPAPPDGQGNDCMPTDQRGAPRPQPPGGRCDIGAYEAKQ